MSGLLRRGDRAPVTDRDIDLTVDITTEVMVERDNFSCLSLQAKLKRV